MKKTSFIFTPIISISILALFSCGGVIGNIEKYRFENTSIESLKNAVQKVYLKNPQLKQFDSLKYEAGNGIGDGDYYCKLNKSGQDFIFQYSYPQYPPPNDTISEIALTSAAKYGEPLKLANRISSLEKTEYRNLFEKYFIAQIKKELKK
jgi:hypothetical protein